MNNIIKTELIADLIRERKLSKTAFCKLCKIGIATFDKIMRGETRIRIKSLFKIAHALEIPVHKLLNEIK